MHSNSEAFARRVKYILAFGFIAISGLYIFRWVLYPEMTFYVDDWNWLHRSTSVFWTNYTVFPRAVYNDRPIGGLLIGAFYNIFGLNYTPYAVMLLSIHITNGILLAVLTSKILRSVFYGSIVGVLFVIDMNVAYQAWWIGSVFDSTSLFFCLCSFLAFLSKKWYSSALTVPFYFLAIRSKEASLPFPFILFAYEFLEHCSSAKVSEIVRSFLQALKATWPVLLVFVAMLGIFLRFYFAVKAADFGPYLPKFDMPTVIEGASIYLRYISFDLLSRDGALLAYVVLTAIALLTWTRAAILGSVGFLIAASPVLVLASQRVPYYGYLPSPYVALLLVALVRRLDVFLGAKLGMTSDYVAKFIVLAATISFTAYVHAIGLYRELLLAVMRENSEAMRTLVAALTHVENHSKIVITGLPPGPEHLFAHAPCFAINVIYKVPSIECHIDGTDAELVAVYGKLTAPKILLHYDHGSVSLEAHSP